MKKSVINQDSHAATKPATIAYLLKGYPRLSETFILQEILGVEQHGLQLELYSIIDPKEDLTHPSVEQVVAPVCYLHSDDVQATQKTFEQSQLWLLKRHPLRLLRVWLYVLFKRRHLLTFQRLLEAGRLAQILSERNVQWLHAHFAHGPTTVADFVHLLIGIPFSFSAHAKDIYQSSPDLLVRKIQRAQFVVTCSDASRRYLLGLLKDLPDAARQQNKIHLVYHGVNTQHFSPAQTQSSRHVSDEPPLILSIGRFVEKKGYRYLIAACKILVERNRRFQCAIYGSGPLKRDVRQQITRLGLEEYVHLHDERTQEDLPDIYRAAAMFVLPCCIASDGDRDGIPNVLLEAMATGLPVVSTTAGGIPELVEHDRNGFLVPEKDSQALANALERLLGDVTLRISLATEARRHIVTHFDAEQNLGLLVECFAQYASHFQLNANLAASFSQAATATLVEKE
ncbi:MAG: glycosyltransferase family 4 protein [Ktedonobacteraceae bacterium]